VAVGRLAVSLPRLGIVFDREFPAGAVVNYARQAEADGLDEVWFIEDCFFTGGVSLSAAALAATERVTVGLGVMPAVARTAAIAAMEIATLANLAPGRFTAGIGHGVQSWMEQMGVRPSSALTTLDETISQVCRLLDGERVAFHGAAVTLDDVALHAPPSPRPLVLAGVQQGKSMQLAGRVADGVILVEGAGPTYVRWALEQAGRTPDDFHVVTFTILAVDEDRRAAYSRVAPLFAQLVSEERAALRVLPFWDELRDRVAAGGADMLIDMPAEHWREIAAVGTLDDARRHLESLADVGVRVSASFPGPILKVGYEQMVTLARLRS